MRDLIDIVGSIYEEDEHQWMLDQIALLEAKKYESIDHENLLKYLSEMAIRDRRELESRFVVLLQHLLKFRVQPDDASRSWLLTVLEQQGEIESLFKGTPSLKTYAPKLYADAYPRAVKQASAETGIPLKDFPAECPWTIDEVQVFEPCVQNN